MIKIENLVFKYDTHLKEANDKPPAIRGINLNIKQGEFVAILGHNGSGKSTLAKLINGLLVPTEGSVTVDGLSTAEEDKIWDIRAKAGMVFQNPDNQIVATIVEEDVAFGAENLGIEPREIRRRVDESLRVVAMEDYKRHAPHLLSGGQKQRVAIAGILAMDPDYIILDEPTAMLDPNGRKEVMDTIMNLNRDNTKTVILITHYMDEAAMADRLIVMEKGNIVLDGSPRDVFSNVDRIKGIGLDVPQVTDLANELRKEGYNIRGDILSIEELVEEVWQY